jgi:hypothetical protein
MNRYTLIKGVSWGTDQELVIDRVRMDFGTEYPG